jgi:xanthosine utilization system XapX-like protein
MVQRATSSVADILYTLLEIRLRSTPMGILWWMLVGIMGISLGVLSLAFIVVWSRIQ